MMKKMLCALCAALCALSFNACNEQSQQMPSPERKEPTQSTFQAKIEVENQSDMGFDTLELDIYQDNALVERMITTPAVRMSVGESGLPERTVENRFPFTVSLDTEQQINCSVMLAVNAGGDTVELLKEQMELENGKAYVFTLTGDTAQTLMLTEESSTSQK